MRRRCAPVFLAVLLLLPGLPTQAGEPATDALPGEAQPSPAATDPTPSAAPPADTSPAVESSPTAEPSPGSTTAAPDPAGGPAVTEASATTEVAVTEPAPPAPPAAGSAADPAGRWIVVLKPGKDAAKVADRHSRSDRLHADGVFRAVGAVAAKLTSAQRHALAADPDVAAVVPDERIETASQLIPTGVSRIGTRTSPMAAINGVDVSVDADVAIVDTGIDATHPDLNVAGGYNCSTSDRTAWRDLNHHGTHVAGTVAAEDNGIGVVGVAPGARLWAVKILDDTGTGLLSWYVCGLDWIAAQRDPSDASRPLIEAVNMSVTKWGTDDGNCGFTNSDILHQAICRVVAQNITVVAAAANDAGPASRRVPASYNEVITVSALADTDGKPGGLGGNRCWSWGTYDVDDTFADFSNYGGDVDLIAPGKCIWSTLPGNTYGYSSGTSMAAPHVTGAVALYKATRPWATPAEVKGALQYLGNFNWKTSSDPDGAPDILLDVSRIGPYGDFSVGIGASALPVNEAGGTQALPFTLARTSTFFEQVALAAAGTGGISATLDRSGSFGFGNVTGTLTIVVPPSTPAGTYPVTLTGTEHGRVRTATVSVVVENDAPTAFAPSARLAAGGRLGSSTLVRAAWRAATDPTSAIARYQVQRSVDGAAWSGWTVSAATRLLDIAVPVGHRVQFRVRAMDVAGNWSPWVAGSTMTTRLIQDNSSLVRRSTGWTRVANAYASGGTLTYSKRAGAYLKATTTMSQVAFVAPVSTSRGSARIYVNGVYVKTVSLYSKTSASRRVVWSMAFSNSTTRTVEIRVVGTYGHPRVDLDALLYVP